MNADLLSLASTAGAFFIVAVSPGPATISNSAIAMTHGRRISLIYGAGLSAGLAFWGVIAATGMGAVLQGSLYLLMVLKVLGGLYLLWLAYQSARSAWYPAAPVTSVVAQQRWFIRGLILNISNPKSVIAYMAALSVGLGVDADYGSLVISTGTCVVVGFATNALYSYLFSLNGMMRIYQRARRKVDMLVALLFAFAGVGLIKSALSN